jgi:hypothetical protein
MSDEIQLPDWFWRVLAAVVVTLVLAGLGVYDWAADVGRDLAGNDTSPTTNPTSWMEDSEPARERDCMPGYTPCLSADAADYDCRGGGGNGPRYTGPVRVTGLDIYGLDADGDGFGCE